MLLSVIIPAHNEEKYIGKTLETLDLIRSVFVAPFEVIVVDDASTDRTAEIAQAKGARVIHVDKRQIAAVRNAGAAEARGRILLFVDADTLPNETVIDQACQACHEGVAGGGAPFVFDEPGGRRGLRLQNIARRLGRRFKYTGGAFIFCQRRVFEAIGGFDERVFAGEELVLARAIKRHGEFRYIDHPVVTSARKLKQFSSMQMLWLFLRVAVNPRLLGRRDKMGMWYSEDVDAAR